MKLHTLALAALVLAFAPEMILCQEAHDQRDARDVYQKRQDTYQVFNRERNAHACIMSIVFIVLYPLGAISIHLPIERIPYLKNTFLKNKVTAIHRPIQLLGAAMMVCGMALGIRIAQYVGYLNHPVPAHPIIGLIVVCTIIVFQPIMGFLQHRYFKNTGGKSIFAYLHRWLGRCAIALGMINSGLGFQLATTSVIVPNRSYILDYVFLGFFVSIWFSLIVYDEFRARRPKAGTDGGENVTLDETKLPRTGEARE